MIGEEFQRHASEVAEWSWRYRQQLGGKRTCTDWLQRGYLARLADKALTAHGETWEKTMRDIEEKIIPGVINWQHPRFHGFYSTGASYPFILGEMITSTLAINAVSWNASPAGMELESVTTDLLAKALDFPRKFLHSENSGGGVIVGTQGEGVLAAMLAARSAALEHLTRSGVSATEGLGKLVGYCSTETHATVAKAAKVAMVHLHVIHADGKGRLRGEALREATLKDIEQGKHPFFVVGNIGTMASCAFDKLHEVGNVAKELPACWFHVDANHAGNQYICPETRYTMRGIELADSVVVDPGKWLLAGTDSACLWFADSKQPQKALALDTEGAKSFEHGNWTVTSPGKFRALALWTSLRTSGLNLLQAQIRNHLRLAQVLQDLIQQDPRFVVTNQVKSNVVCFRLLAPDSIKIPTNRLNQMLLTSLNSSGQIYLSPAMICEDYNLKFSVNHLETNEELIKSSWTMIVKEASKLLNDCQQGLKDDLNDSQLQREERYANIKRLENQTVVTGTSLKDEAMPLWIGKEGGDVQDETFHHFELHEDLMESFNSKSLFSHYF